MATFVFHDAAGIILKAMICPEDAVHRQAPAQGGLTPLKVRDSVDIGTVATTHRVDVGTGKLVKTFKTRD